MAEKVFNPKKKMEKLINDKKFLIEYRRGIQQQQTRFEKQLLREVNDFKKLQNQRGGLFSRPITEKQWKSEQRLIDKGGQILRQFQKMQEQASGALATLGPNVK